jgi:hypothetical protein
VLSSLILAGWFLAAVIVASAQSSGESSSAPTPNFTAIPSAPKVPPGQPIFKDEFASFDASWGSPGRNANVTDGYFILVPIRGESVMVPNTKYRYRDFAASVNVTPTPALHGSESAGLVFWGRDSNDYYVAAISNTGKVSVIELNGGKRILKAGKQGATPDPFATQVITINVSARANGVEVSAWGATLSLSEVRAPKDGGFIGLYAESSKRAGWIWRFSKLAVGALPN